MKVNVTLLLIGVILLVLGIVLVMIGKNTNNYSDVFVLAIAAIFVSSAWFLSVSIHLHTAILEIIFGILASSLGLYEVGILKVLSIMGGVFLMFLAGIEVDIYLIRRFMYRSIIIGLTGFFAPFAVVATCLCFMGYDFMESIVTAASISVTGVALVYAMLRRVGPIRRAWAQIIIASAMLTDIVGLLIIMTFIAGLNITSIFYPLVMVIVVVVLPKLIRHIPGHLEGEIEVRVIIMLLLVLTMLSEIMGIHAVFSAFILGIAVSEFVKARALVEEKIKALTFGFLAPIFFYGAGLKIKITALIGGIVLALIVTSIVFIIKVSILRLILDKVLGLKGFSIPGLFLANIVVSIVAATAGLESGIISETMYNVIIASSLILTIVGAIMARTMPSVEE